MAPEPLPEPLVRRIRADWNRRAAGPAVWRLRWLVSVAAAAAVVTIALVLPRGPVENPAPAARRTIALSPREAAEIVSAFDLLRWDSTFDENLKSVSAAVAHINRDLRRQQPELGGDGAGDDWDVPPPADKRRSGLEPELVRTMALVGERIRPA